MFQSQFSFRNIIPGVLFDVEHFPSKYISDFQSTSIVKVNVGRFVFFKFSLSRKALVSSKLLCNLNSVYQCMNYHYCDAVGFVFVSIYTMRSIIHRIGAADGALSRMQMWAQ